MKTKELADGSIVLAFNAKASTNGDEIFNPEKANKPKTSAREFESPYVRFWDVWWTAEPLSLWYTTLQKDLETRQYRISDAGFVNALKDTGLENPPFPDPLSPGANYDLSASGIVFSARDPDVDKVQNLRVISYYLPISDFTKPPFTEAKAIRIPGFKGSIQGGVFSPDGKALALLVQRSIEFFDYKGVAIINDLCTLGEIMQLTGHDTREDENEWDLDPSSILWSNDGEEIYLMAEEKARLKLFKVSLPSSAKGQQIKPEPLTSTGSLSAVYPLSKSKSDSRLLISKTSYTESFILTIADAATGESKLLASASQEKDVFRISQPSEFVVQSRTGEYDIQSWVHKPSNFDSDKKYPVALLIHGGPTGAWTDVWSTRWNPAIIAEQGYIVISPNPTGSTGFGEAMVKRIQGEWGGRCYEDIVDCFEYVKKEVPYADTGRTVALGASFGGYMMNVSVTSASLYRFSETAVSELRTRVNAQSLQWIAGQPLAKELKAIVCHDGIFSLNSMLGSDVPYSLRQDFLVEPWEDQERWLRHDPARFTQNWSTPTLVIHSSLDYRCPIVEGLAMYNVCQMKKIPSRYLSFPDENHWVLKHENSLRWHMNVLGWINKYANVKGGVELEPPTSEPAYGPRR